MKKTLLFLRDLMEIYLPMAAFAVMFLTFVAQIAARYLFNYPLTWAYEITVIGFTWTVLLGACYAMRSRTHVMFTMIVDLLSPKKAALVRTLGNLIIVITFVILIVPTFRYVQFISFQSTSVFKIKLSYIFAPIVYFFLSVIGYTLSEMVADFRIMRGGETK